MRWTTAGPGIDVADRRRRSPGRSTRATSGTRSRLPRGVAPIRACSSTPRSTRGTPARRRAGSTRRTRAASTCSSTTRRATSRRINLLKFYDAESRTFDVDQFEHAVDSGRWCSRSACSWRRSRARRSPELSYRYRTLGLGYANLGAMLMQAGIPYDSDEGRAICGTITSILTGRAYATSARAGRRARPFPGTRRTATPCCA
jgi:hypothetical protein